MSLLPAAHVGESDTGVQRPKRLLTSYPRSSLWVGLCLIGGAVADVITRSRLL